MNGNTRGLVDQDIQPDDYLREQVGDRISLSFGAETDEPDLIQELSGVDVLFTTSRLPVTERIIVEARDLDVVAKIGTGLDSIDLDAAAKRDLTVVYTPGVNAISVAEHALSLALAVRRNVVQGQRILEEGQWRDEMAPSQPLVGRTVGIIGFGDVGSRFAGLLDGFNSRILAYDPYVHEIDTQLTGAELVSLDELLSSSDTVVVCAELTDETRGMIDDRALEQMRNDATLVNVARGPIVDQEAFIDAVNSENIAGGALDVFEEEPLDPGSELHDLRNVITTPHIAASSIEARKACIETLVEVAVSALEGEVIPDRFVAVP